MTGRIEPIVMPKWGLAMTEGTVVGWEAGEGDRVDQGQDILEIETTKITNVFEAPAGGTLRRQVVHEGDTVPVGALLGVLADEEVPDEEIDSFVSGFVVEADDGEAAGEGAPEPSKAEAGGRTLRYLEMGAGEGTPVLLVHGFGADLNAWMFVQPTLAEGRRTVALDLPGHGGSQKDVGEGTPEALADTLSAFMDEVGLERAHVVAHSLGGAVALALAAAEPNRVSGLTLIAPAGLGDEINHDFITGFIEAGRRKEMKPVLGLLVADPSLVSRDMIEDVLKAKRIDGAEEALRTVVAANFAEGRQAVLLRDALAGLSCPVEIVWGEADRILPASHAEGLPEAVRVRRMADVGHMPHMEAAGEVTRLILAGLE